MSNIFFSSSEITIYRKRRIHGTNRFSMSATYTPFSADIQPATKERVEMFQGRYGAVYTGFVDVLVDVREGDQVIVTDTGKRYSVKGVQKWQGAGLLDHLEIVLVSQDGY